MLNRSRWCKSAVACLVALALVFGGVAGSICQAAPAGTLAKGFKGKGKRKGKRKGNHAQQVAKLRSVIALLEQADTDYKGHRVKAIKDLKAAIRALGHNDNQSTKGTKVPQVTSDNRLNTAIGMLKGVHSKLAGKRSSRAGHDVGRAIKELKTALKIA